MQPYRPVPDPAAAEPWSPTFGTSPWSFSTRFNALLSVRELVTIALAVAWADLWAFGLLASTHAPRFELVLVGWLGLVVAHLGRPRSWRTYGASLLLAVLALTASAWNGGLGLGTLAVMSVAFVPGAARLRTFSVLEPLGTLFSYACMAVPRGMGASMRRARQALVGRKVGAVPWLELGVALGLLVGFGGLFVLANPFVRESANSAVGALAQVFSRFDRLALRAACDVGMVFAFCGLLRSVPSTMLLSTHETTEATASARASRMATMTLVLQNALFAVYNSIDAVFLGARVAPPGMTLQKYAHDGAFWLTVTLFFVTVVAYAFRGAARTGSPLVRKLMNAWILQGLVLGANVFFRLALHVRTSGLSDTRFVGALGAAAVVGGLLVVWRAIRGGHTRAWILRAQATVLGSAVLVFALLPTNLLSALYDVHAIERGERLPLVHVVELSRRPESAPLLLPLLADDDPIVREGVAAMLLDEEYDGPTMAQRRARSVLDERRESMRDMLRASAALHALVDARGRVTSESEGNLDARLVDEAITRFSTYVRYMDDQDANISPRLPENGTLLMDPNTRY